MQSDANGGTAHTGGNGSGGNGGTATTTSAAATHDALAELRLLLIGPERREIAQIKQDIASISTVSAEEVGTVLPQAVRHSTRTGTQIDEALVPVVEEALGLSAKRDPTKLGDLLFPVMGPAIRKAVREAIGSMIEAFNQTIEHSVSPRAIGWRVESWRTGQPFSEVIFLHTMLYRVEQVFLIHRETGLLLQHASASHPPVKDADVVSGMLTAIQDFVRDSFKTKDNDTLDRMTVGDLTVLIEQGPSASLAGVVRGHAPQDLRFVFQRALSDVHSEQADDLRAFNGDTSVFAVTRPHLEGCLQFRPYTQGQSAAARKPLITPARVAALVALVALGVFGYLYLRSGWRWEAYLERLRNEPGIVITSAGHGWRRSRVEGLRDPLARDPRSLIAQSEVDPSTVESRWKPYHAMEPPFVLQRAQTALAPPDTVSLQLGDDGTLDAIGSAPRQWIADARRLAAAVPGITKFKDDRLTDTDFEGLQRLRDRVQDYNLLFPPGEALLVPASRATLNSLVSDLSQLARDAGWLGYAIDVEVRGHTDSTGADSLNSELSQQRAEVILAALRRLLGANTSNVRLMPRGVGATSPLRAEGSEADRAWNRRAAVVVTIAPRGQEREGAR